MLVLDAFAVAKCGVSMYAAGRPALVSYCWLMLVGPLEPVSTELGVDVALPLSENTVLVTQQLFSNLLSAILIPFFKALPVVLGTERISETAQYERGLATRLRFVVDCSSCRCHCLFRYFNGRHLRYNASLSCKNGRNEDK